ncbi:hypothetical protein EG829_17975 [bacterium]|nr:hypothetical protein [bacterium]
MDTARYITVPPVAVSTATVVERRYVQSGTVTTPGQPGSTIVASMVEYSIQSGPAQAIGVTLRRSDWESGDRTGTTFSYFRSNPSHGMPYFHGHVDGDVYGILRYIGTDAQGYSITETRKTSNKTNDMAGWAQNTEVSTTVGDNPIISVIEPEVVHTGVEIRVTDGIQYLVAVPGAWPKALTRAIQSTDGRTPP